MNDMTVQNETLKKLENRDEIKKAIASRDF